MHMTRAYQVIVSVLKEKLGFVVIENEEEDFAINDYIPDSMTFIQFIIALEETLDMELSDDFLDSDLLSSAIGFAEKLDLQILQ